MPEQAIPAVKIALAQINLSVGAIEENAAKIIATVAKISAQSQADVIVFPELAITAYSPEDLLLRSELYARVQKALALIQQHCGHVFVIVGAPLRENNHNYNAAFVLYQGKIVGVYKKQYLPNDGVFNELRYFTRGKSPLVIDVLSAKLGIIICEDGWHEGPAAEAKEAGAEILIQLNASPYHQGKLALRKEMLATRAIENALPIVSVYQVGAQDELVFDGSSIIVDANGQIIGQLPAFTESLGLVTFNKVANNWQACASQLTETLSPEAEMYQALVLAVRDYINKNGFPGVILGLSGGIDSALTLAIAVDALGSERVEAVLMPSCYTSALSTKEALAQIKCLGVKHQIIPIDELMQSFLRSLAPSFAGFAADVTEENLQARCRGVILMALSNKFGNLVLTTSNKSEVAVGYATLYGDMAGGFAVLKDVWKTWVYRLVHYRNSLAAVIPSQVITRAPSAELRENQTDQDSLPDYAILDAIMQRYVEENQSAEEIIAVGFLAEDVNNAIALLKRSQYKRQQGPIGPKVTKRSFGADWRYPLTSKF